MTPRYHTRTNYPHLLAVMRAKLVQDGFLIDTPERRALAKAMAGPRPNAARHELEDCHV